LEPAVIGALSAILGSAVGGSATFATAWLTQRTEGRRASIESEIRKREALYVEFIAEGSKLAMEGLDHQVESPQRLYPLYAILNRIRLRSSAEVLAAADDAINRILESCFSPNLSPEEIRKLLLERPSDPLRGFSEACRSELERLERGTL
jgi:hypothetical protein